MLLVGGVVGWCCWMYCLGGGVVGWCCCVVLTLLGIWVLLLDGVVGWCCCMVLSGGVVG